MPDLRAAALAGSGPEREIDSGSASPDEQESLDKHSAAINTGLRWTLVARPIIETANLIGVAVLARLVSPADFGRYSIALIVLLLATVPTWAVGYTDRAARGDRSGPSENRINPDYSHGAGDLRILLSGGVHVRARPVWKRDRAVGVSHASCVLHQFGEHRAIFDSLTPTSVPAAELSRPGDYARGHDYSDPASGGRSTRKVDGPRCRRGQHLPAISLLCSWVRPPVPNFRLRSAREILRSGIPAASGAAGLVGFQNCDYVIVGARLGALQAGYYFRAYTLAVVYQKKVSQVMTRTLAFPVMSRASTEEDRARLRQRMVHTVTPDPVPPSDRAGNRRAQVRHLVLRPRMARDDRAGADPDPRRCGDAGGRGSSHIVCSVPAGLEPRCGGDGAISSSTAAPFSPWPCLACRPSRSPRSQCT